MLSRRVTALAMFSAISFSSVVELSADTGGAFANLAGTWSGSGQIRLEGGRTENLRCRASYTDHGGGTTLGISIRCASASNKVDLHASLKASGSNVSGQWEEREFNAAGNATGTATGNRLSLTINGGGLAASMNVTTNGARQSVSITAQNVTLKGIQIALARE